ncbi:HEPN domain-containing protein [Rathayibacter soli]|uniref:HEPN domain-containing protein n=1 Tax=Rathayibacter soli TaxID=3144168 RepID=UPI0027E4B540|nr:HEPN domain-containing protein [Glaciibacter superstes]
MIELKKRELLHSNEIDLQTVLPRWFQFNKDGGRIGVNVLQAADYKDDQYVETNFLNAMTALESLYLALSKHHPAAFPRTRPSQSDDVAAKIGQARQALTPDLHVALRSTSKRDLQLKEKISTLLAWVGPTQFAVIVPTQNQAEWIAKAHAARNDLTHLGSFTAHVDTSGLNALQLGIRWLLKLALLKHLGIADELLVRVARSADGQAASYSFTNYLMPNLG